MVAVRRCFYLALAMPAGISLFIACVIIKTTQCHSKNPCPMGIRAPAGSCKPAQPRRYILFPFSQATRQRRPLICHRPSFPKNLCAKPGLDDSGPAYCRIDLPALIQVCIVTCQAIASAKIKRIILFRHACCVGDCVGDATPGYGHAQLSFNRNQEFLIGLCAAISRHIVVFCVPA